MQNRHIFSNVTYLLTQKDGRHIVKYIVYIVLANVENKKLAKELGVKFG